MNNIVISMIVCIAKFNDSDRVGVVKMNDDCVYKFNEYYSNRVGVVNESMSIRYYSNRVGVVKMNELKYRYYSNRVGVVKMLS